MFKEYFYKGRHRAPTHTGKKLAALTAATALPLIGSTATAHAAEPDWGPIIKCESGGNATAKNPNSSASGLFQFISGTWAAYGGLEFAPTARQATIAEQHIVANRAYAREGYKPWNASKDCWDDEIGKGSKVTVRLDAPKHTAKKAEAHKPHAPKPVDKPAPQRVVPDESVPTLGTPGEYTVKPGDTLTDIAIANNVQGGWNAVYEKNRNVVEHADWIFPGEKLNLN